jgi:hypothetical protein
MLQNPKKFQKSILPNSITLPLNITHATQPYNMNQETDYTTNVTEAY